MSTDILGVTELLENQASKYLTHNEALRQIEGMLVRVLSRTNAGPPGAPSAGDVYIVDSAIGLWVTADVNDLAHYYSSAWHFYAPVTGMSLWCIDEGARISFNGTSWVVESSILDISGTLADGEYRGIIDRMTVDENTVGFASALCVAADGNLEMARDTGVPLVPCAALAIDTGTGSNKKILKIGRIRNDSWSWTPGDIIYVGHTAGILTATEPLSLSIHAVGQALTSNIIWFNPGFDVF